MPRIEPETIEISVVVPLLDERENVGTLHRRISGAMAEARISGEIVLIDDGSRDGTGAMIDALAQDDPRVVAVHLTRNFGHQAAVSAGIDQARGRAVIVLDADGQDPPELIGEMVRLWRTGVDVIFAVRTRRKEHAAKRWAYAAFYRLLGAISDHPIPRDSGDFCLMDRRVVEAMKALPERVRFVRGLRAFVGFTQVALPYNRPARAAGQTKYSLGKLVRLAVDGLVSFSGQPLRMVTYLGMISALIALGLAAWVIGDAILTRTAPRGWASTLVVVLFMGSVQLLSLGVIGEYVRLIFLEAKGRPTYIVKDTRRTIAKPLDRRRAS